MKKVLTPILLIASLFASQGHAWNQTSSFQPLGRTEGINYLEPAEFFNGKNADILKDYPEMAQINAETQPMMKRLLDFAMANGVIYRRGQNPNYQGYLDIYSGTIDTSNLIIANFGMGSDTKVGRSHFPIHDTVHLTAGIPGPRLSDMADPRKFKEIKNRIVLHILRKEAYATSWSAYYYAKWYFDLVAKNQGRENLAAFAQYNRGQMSIGPVTPEDQLKIVSSYTDALTIPEAVNNVFKGAAAIRGCFNAPYYDMAVSLGVPQAVPAHQCITAKAMRHFLMKHVLPLGATFYMNFLDPTTSYLKMRKYAIALVENYYKPWNVQWSTRFNIGMPIDELDGYFKKRVDQFKRGELLADVEPASFEKYQRQFLRREVEAFGLKLFELRHILEERQITGKVVELDQLVDSAVALAADANDSSGPDLQSMKTRLGDLHRAAQDKFPAEKIIDFSKTKSGTKPEMFWQDISTFFINKPDGIKNAGTLDDRKNFELVIHLNESGIRALKCQNLLMRIHNARD